MLEFITSVQILATALELNDFISVSKGVMDEARPSGHPQVYSHNTGNDFSIKKKP